MTMTLDHDETAKAVAAQVDLYEAAKRAPRRKVDALPGHVLVLLPVELLPPPEGKHKRMPKEALPQESSWITRLIDRFRRKAPPVKRRRRTKAEIERAMAEKAGQQRLPG